MVVRLVLLLPDSELLTGESLMLRRPLQKQTGRFMLLTVLLCMQSLVLICDQL